mgnify:CR=1 FL=1|jgi:hypothetical protein
MYYAEKIINGVLHYRTHPRGKWREISPLKLTQKILDLQNKL